MSDPTKIQTVSPALPVAQPSSTAKEAPTHERASALSLSELEELFGALEQQYDINTKKGKASLQESEEKLLEQITELLEEIETAGKGKGTGAAISELKGYVKEFYDGDNSALGKILSIVMPTVLIYAQEHPNDIMSVIKAFAPLMRDNGQEAIAQVKLANEAFKNFQKAYAADKDPNKAVKLAEVGSALFGSGQSSQIERALDAIQPAFIELMEKDQARGELIYAALFKILTALSAASDEGAINFAKAFIGSDALKELIKLSIPELKLALTNMGSDVDRALKDPVPHFIPGIIIPNTPVYFTFSLGKIRDGNDNIRAILIEAMMLLQMLQGVLTQSQSKQNQFTIAIDQAKTKEAIEQMKEINQKIQKEIDEQRKAARNSWWTWLIKAVVAVVATLVSAITMGVGAAIAAALIGVFMTTPLMQITVKAIADKISKDLYHGYYKQFKAEGKSDEDAQRLAQEKADAVGNLIAQIVVIIAVVVVSFGAGGISSAGEGAANTSAEFGEEMINFAAEETAEIAAEETSVVADLASKFTFNATQAAKVAAFQGLSVLGSTNIWLSAMQTDPEWCEKHEKLMIAIDAVAEIATMIAAMVTGSAVMQKALEGGAQFSEQIAGLLAANSKYLFAINALLQTGDGAYGLGTGIKNAEYLKTAARLTQEIGEMEAEFIRTQSQISQLQDSQGKTNKLTVGMVNADGQMMGALSDVAGLDFATVTKALERAN